MRSAADKVLAIIHQENAPPGHVGEAVLARGHELEVASFAAAEEPRHPLADYRALIVFGGAPQVDEDDVLPWLSAEKRALGEALEADVPTLGICLGGQLMAQYAGAWVGPTPSGRRGWAQVEVSPEAGADPVFAALPASFTTIRWHGYQFHLPPRATALATAPDTLQAFRLDGRRAWGVQFHPEATPELIAAWIAALRQRQPREFSEAWLDRYEGEIETHAAGQAQLAASLTDAFLDQAAGSGSAG